MREVQVSKRLPKILRHDALLFQVGTTVRRLRKDRDQWELVLDSEAEGHALYYMDIRPTAI